MVGVGIGPDGVYFVPLLPDRLGRSAVFKVAYDEKHAHPFSLEKDPEVLIAEHGCAGCHRINGAGGGAGPALDGEKMVDRIRSRLESNEYTQAVATVDRLEREPYASYRQARAEVLGAAGDEKVRTWLKYRIVEPRFDDPRAQMPNLGISQTEARAITAYLMREKAQDGDRIRDRAEAALARLLPSQAGRRELFLFFAGGFLLGACALALLPWFRRLLAG